MQTTTPSSPYKGFRFPQEIISHAVWLYFRFSLSYPDVEELLADRGIIVTYETVRQWCLKFGSPSGCVNWLVIMQHRVSADGVNQNWLGRTFGA